MEEYKELKQNILSLLKSDDDKNKVLGIELFKSQLKMSINETIAFVLDNGLCPRRKLNKLHCFIFDRLGFELRRHRARHENRFRGRDNMETIWKHTTTESTLEFDMTGVKYNSIYTIGRDEHILEFCLFDRDRINYVY